MDELFNIITIKTPQEKKKRSPRRDDPVIKNNRVNECLKITLYTRDFLEKQTVKQLEKIIMNYKKKHFKDFEKNDFRIVVR